MEKSEENSLNKSKPSQVNRGVELLLRNKRRKTLQKPKTFHIMFIIAFLEKGLAIIFKIFLVPSMFGSPQTR